MFPDRRVRSDSRGVFGVPLRSGGRPRRVAGVGVAGRRRRADRVAQAGRRGGGGGGPSRAVRRQAAAAAAGHQHTEGVQDGQGGGRHVGRRGGPRRGQRHRRVRPAVSVRPGVAVERVQPAPVEPGEASGRVQAVRAVPRRHESVPGSVAKRIFLGGKE